MSKLQTVTGEQVLLDDKSLGIHSTHYQYDDRKHQIYIVILSKRSIKEDVTKISSADDVIMWYFMPCFLDISPIKHGRFGKLV